MPAGVYLHIPFCKSRCSYCDFATDVYKSNDSVERYVRAMCSEVGAASVGIRGTRNTTEGERDGRFGAITGQSNAANRPSAEADGSNAVDTIYFGGGTPSLLKPEQVERILEAVSSRFEVANVAEITMEMNPATVTPETLAAYRKLGVNRASFGVQTFNDRDLKLLARGHDANDARNTFRRLRDACFDNISFDLIAGLPGQAISEWRNNLDEAIRLSPEHISLYLLEIHEGTPLAEQVRSGRRPMPDEDLAAEMYEIMIGELSGAGYVQYEISNFCKPGYRSRHNSKYWLLDPVFGFGVSAHSFDGRQRYANERDTNAYVDSLEKTSSAEVMRESIDLASDAIFLGLRMENGVELGSYKERFGINLLEEYDSDLKYAFDAGLLEINEERIRLTRKGKLFSNDVFAIFV